MYVQKYTYIRVVRFWCLKFVWGNENFKGFKAMLANKLMD